MSELITGTDFQTKNLTQVERRIAKAVVEELDPKFSAIESDIAEMKVEIKEINKVLAENGLIIELPLTSSKKQKERIMSNRVMISLVIVLMLAVITVLVWNNADYIDTIISIQRNFAMRITAIERCLLEDLPVMLCDFPGS